MPSIPEHIRKAKAIDLKTNVEEDLKTVSNSACHFFARVPVDGIEIRFRLDWTDQDEYGDPTLDADFFEPGSKKPLERTEDMNAVHHTTKTVDLGTGRRSYEFQYGTMNVDIEVQLTSVRTITGVARIVRHDESPKTI